MRIATMMFAALLLSACASGRLQPVPETGAFSLKYVEIDGDYYIGVEKVGVQRSVTMIASDHANRRDWNRGDWERYANALFPQDEINFDVLRQLRGSNLVPVGLVSPTAAAVPPCDTTTNKTYAKVQTRLIRQAPRRQASAEITMVTTCELHQGLSPSQYAGIHQRPNPYRFPTRYETIVDLDRDNKPEQRNVRIRNVSKALLVEFINRETVLEPKLRRELIASLDRM